jgi:hypothetical protein
MSQRTLPLDKILQHDSVFCLSFSAIAQRPRCQPQQYAFAFQHDNHFFVDFGAVLCMVGLSPLMRGGIGGVGEL